MGAVPESIQITCVVLFYWFSSISVVFANKWVLKNFDFPYPLFLTWIQLMVSEALIIGTGFLSPRVKEFSLFAPLEWDFKIAIKVLPLTGIWLLMLAANNICLQYTEVTFYQVVRSLTILWSIVIQKYYLPSLEIGFTTILACFVVMSGFIAGAFGEINFMWEGLVAGVLSSALIALYNNVMKSTISCLDGNVWRLMIYNTTLAIPMAVPFLHLSGEFLFAKGVPISNQVWIGIVLSGVLGYLINVAMFLQMKMTSPLTGAISGTAKGVLQSACGWLVWRNEISALNALGIILVLAGSSWYSWIGYQKLESQKGKAKTS